MSHDTLKLIAPSDLVIAMQNFDRKIVEASMLPDPLLPAGSRLRPPRPFSLSLPLSSFIHGTGDPLRFDAQNPRDTHSEWRAMHER
jgi:hypothetical protein